MPASLAAPGATLRSLWRRLAPLPGGTRHTICRRPLGPAKSRIGGVRHTSSRVWAYVGPASCSSATSAGGASVVEWWCTRLSTRCACTASCPRTCPPTNARSETSQTTPVLERSPRSCL